MNFVFHSEVKGGVMTPSISHPVVRYFSTAEIEQLAATRMLRGHHIPLAISDHRQGQRLPLEVIQTIPAMARSEG